MLMIIHFWFMLVFGQHWVYWAITWPIHLVLLVGIWVRFIEEPARHRRALRRMEGVE